MKVCRGVEGFHIIKKPGKVVSKFIKYTIPSSWRRFENGYWLVHESKIIETIQLGYQIHGFVDYSDLSDDLQMQIASLKATWPFSSVKETVEFSVEECFEDYRTLYLHPDAPTYIVEAVWKAIVKKLHPDIDPSCESEFRNFKDAYERIKKANQGYDREVKRTKN